VCNPISVNNVNTVYAGSGVELAQPAAGLTSDPEPLTPNAQSPAPNSSFKNDSSAPVQGGASAPPLRRPPEIGENIRKLADGTAEAVPFREDPSVFQQPAKRRYTLSEKALAARRLSVEKATRAASDRRRLGNPTLAEKESWRLNLLRARQVLHDDHTWKYAPCFRHGLTAISLERSLVLAGESLDEYRAHLARFDRLVQGMEAGPLSDPAKLARATALVAWRRLRALRLDREWTLRALTDVLQQAIRVREIADGSGQPSGNSPSLAADGLGYLGPDPLFTLGLGLEDASCSWVGTWRALTRLNNRFDQLWCALVDTVGGAPPFLPSDVWWERGRMRPSPIVEEYTRWPAEVLGNPLRRPSEILAYLADRAVTMKPVWGWNFHPMFRSLDEADNYRWQTDEQRRRAEPERLEQERLTVAGDPHYCLLGRVRRAQLETRGRSGPGISVKDDGEESRSVTGEALPLPETFEQFLALVERAFGHQPPPAERLADEAQESASSGDTLPVSQSELPAPTDTERVRHLAELLWQRVERVRERAESEARRLAKLVDAYGDALSWPRSEEFLRAEATESGLASRNLHAEASRGREAQAEVAELPEEPEETNPPETLPTEILQVFREKRSGRLRKGGNERVIRLEIYDLAVSRFGKQPDLELLKRTHDRFDQLHHEFFEVFFSQAHPADAGSG
jgi:hypothetical protein